MFNPLALTLVKEEKSLGPARLNLSGSMKLCAPPVVKWSISVHCTRNVYCQNRNLVYFSCISVAVILE